MEYPFLGNVISDMETPTCSLWSHVMSPSKKRINRNSVVKMNPKLEFTIHNFLSERFETRTPKGGVIFRRMFCVSIDWLDGVVMRGTFLETLALTRSFRVVGDSLLLIYRSYQPTGNT